MRPPDPDQLVTHEYAQTCIRVKARQLCRRSDFGRSERRDIEQELWLRLLAQAEHFDPARSALNTFIDRVVNSAAASLVRARECEKRADGFLAKSLENLFSVQAKRKKSLRSCLSPDDRLRHTFTSAKSDLDYLADDEAFAAALAAMPDDVRDLCVRVMDGTTPTQVARQLGLSRRQVRRLLDVARVHLEQAGWNNS